MLEQAEIGAQVGKKDYAKQAPELRVKLLEAQRALARAPFNVVIAIAGNDPLGIHQTINVLHEWMDARGLETNVHDEPTDEERERPRYWRYWRQLPAHGRIGIYSRAWTGRALLKHLTDELDDAGFQIALRRIRHFERTLVHDGTLVIKFWLHIGEEEARERRRLAEQDPLTHWQFSRIDYELLHQYQRGRRVIEHLLRETSTDHVPWHVIDSSDSRHRHLAVGRGILKALKQHLEHGHRQVLRQKPELEALGGKIPDILASLDLSPRMAKDVYERELLEQQRRLHLLHRRAREERRSTIVVFEGWDAAGKGGAIRRMLPALDAEAYRVISIQAPTPEELSHHYLWRFWRSLPRAGHMALFDRSWYGRVLVERVEGFARDNEWKRAYDEINDFEEQLHEHGYRIIKFWLHIDPDEQLDRFQRREQLPHKMHKINDEDYRNRKKWTAYERAANEMIARCSTEFAPWHLIPANSKRFTRIAVLKAVCAALEG